MPSLYVYIHFRCVAGINGGVRLAKQETLTPPGPPGLTSGLQGSVNVHRRALLLVPQWQCISSFVFYISTNFASNVYVVSSMPILFPLCHFCFFYAHLRHKSEQNLNTRVGKRYTRQSIFCKTCAPAIGLFHRGNKIVRQTIQEPKLLQYLLNMNYFPTCTSWLVVQHLCQVSFKSMQVCWTSWEDKLKCVKILSVKDHNSAKICRTWIISPHVLLDLWCNNPAKFHSNPCKDIGGVEKTS